MAVIVTLIIFSVISQYIARYDYRDVNLPERFTPPCLSYPLSTDFLGRDMLSLMIWPTVVASTIDVLLGLVSGYVWGIFDEVIIRSVDILMSFLGLLLVLAILAVLGPGLMNAILAVARANNDTLHLTQYPGPDTSSAELQHAGNADKRG